MIIAVALPIAVGAFGLAMLLATWRLFRGPTTPDRILALDTLYIDAAALSILIGLQQRTTLFFEVALLISMLGFVGTVVLSKYLSHGDITE